MCSNLVETVVGVLEDVAGVVAELLANGDEVHGDQQRGEGEEAEGALPPDSLQRRHVVLGHELLLVDHLRGHDDLRAHDEDVAEQNVGGGLVRLGDIPGVIATDDVAEVLGVEEGLLLLPLDGGGVVLSAATATIEDVADADGEEAANDKEDPDPLVAEESLL